MVCFPYTHYEKQVSASLPREVVAEVKTVEGNRDRIAGDRAAELHNGMRVQVPKYIQAGDKVVIKTADGSFARRAEGGSKL